MSVVQLDGNFIREGVEGSADSFAASEFGGLEAPDNILKRNKTMMIHPRFVNF